MSWGTTVFRTFLVALSLFSLCRSQSPRDAFVGEFVLLPVSSTADTSLSVFRGTLTIVYKPQIWHMEFDLNSQGYYLTNTRRWVSTESGLLQPQNAELTYWTKTENNVTTILTDSGCCTHAPLFDPFEIIGVNQPVGILFGGRPAILKLVSGSRSVVNIDPFVDGYESATASLCPLKCYAPVDVMFQSDASGSIDLTPCTGDAVTACIDRRCCAYGSNWETIRQFIGDFKNRYEFKSDFSGARFGLVLQSAYQSEGNQNGQRIDVECRFPNINSSSTNPADWGVNLKDAITNGAGAVNWITSNCQNRPGSNWDNPPAEDMPCACVAADECSDSSDCNAAWSQLDAELSGNKLYFDYRLARMNNNWLRNYGDGFLIIQATSVGQGIYQAGTELIRGHRGKQQILVTLTDGLSNSGLTITEALRRTKEPLLALDGPEPTFVSVGVGPSVDDNQLLAAADGNERNRLSVDNFAELEAKLDELVSLSCSAEYNLCPASCQGLCSPCKECLCPPCPDVDCRTSLGCDLTTGLCLYEDIENCCPEKLVEQCEKKGGVLDGDCECQFPGSDGDNTAAVVGGTIGGLIGAVLLGLLALLVILGLLAALVAIIILILKAQAIAAAIASLGANAFGAGGSSSNPTYEGNTFEGDNPLFSGGGL